LGGVVKNQAPVLLHFEGELYIAKEKEEEGGGGEEKKVKSTAALVLLVIQSEGAVTLFALFDHEVLVQSHKQ